MVFTHVEAHPQAVHQGDVHDGCTAPYQLSPQGEYVTHLPVHRCSEYRLLDVRFHFGNTTLGLAYLCRGYLPVLHLCPSLSHLVLPACSLLGGHHRVEVRLCLITLLRGGHPFGIEPLHPLERLSGNIHSRHGLLPHLVGGL